MELTVNQLLDKIDTNLTIDDLNNDPDLAQARIGLIELKANNPCGGLQKVENTAELLTKIEKATKRHYNAHVAAFTH